MNKKTLIMIILFVAAFLMGLIKMIVVGPFEWPAIAASIICGGYGIKRSLDESIFGDILILLCVALMVCVTFNIQL